MQPPWYPFIEIETEVQMERMRQLRKEKGLSQAQAAVMAGMDPATWNRLEQGKGNPNLRTLERVADALGVEVVELLGKARRRSSLEPSFNDVLAEERLRPGELFHWTSLLKHIGGLLMDLDETYELTDQTFAQMTTLSFTTAGVYRTVELKARATPEEVRALEEAEEVLRLGLEMLEQRYAERHDGITKLDEYKKNRNEAISALRGTA
jgi:transcriptional regulator with XRE-family HTH domain